MESVNAILESDDPLSDGAVTFLLGRKEEDPFVDYKRSFNGDDRTWLEFTKDVLSFSNTGGGFLVFGVEDDHFEPVGLDASSIALLRDPNILLQKVNRHVEPDVVGMRCREFCMKDKQFVIVFIPPPKNITHIVSKDGEFAQTSGEKKVVLRQGTTYIRRSGCNHLMDARDIDEIIGRRIDYYKASLLNKIARVVEAPSSSEVFILTESPSGGAHRNFVIDDAPEAIPVKGMSFTVSPTDLPPVLVPPVSSVL